MRGQQCSYAIYQVVGREVLDLAGSVCLEFIGFQDNDIDSYLIRWIREIRQRSNPNTPTGYPLKHPSMVVSRSGLSAMRQIGYEFDASVDCEAKAAILDWTEEDHAILWRHNIPFEISWSRGGIKRKL